MRDTALPSWRRALILIAVVSVSSAAARVVPLRVELDGCVQPTPACDARDVVTLNEGDRKLTFAVETLRILSSSAATSSGLLTEMKLRPLRVYGPDELVQRLTSGARLRVRAALRLRERYLLVQSVEPRPPNP
jgi:hypothetical protein